MKLLKINTEDQKGGFFLNPKTLQKDASLESAYRPIETISKQDVFDMLDYLLESPVELDPYVETSLPNPVQQLIYKNLYENFAEALKNKEQIIKDIDNQFSEAEKKYQEQPGK
jgi:hypothetical protein